MTDPQENKLGMYRTAQNVLTANSAESATVAALVTQAANLDSSIALIDSLAATQSGSTAGITQNKAILQDQMIDTAVRVAGAMKALASATNDPILAAQADVDKTKLVRARDEVRDKLAQDLHDHANARIIELKDYGILPATLAGFQTRISAYKGQVAAPQTAIAQKSSITDLLDQEFARADMILEERIDGLLEQFKGSGTTFYADYQNSRQIIDTGAQKKAPAPPPGP